MRKTSLIITIVSLLILATGCNPQPPIATQPDIKQQPSQPQPVVFYSEKISDESTDSRSWPTIRIYKRIGQQKPEVLVDSLGKVGEYPLNFTVSKDKKTIYSNLESRLVAIDTKTGSIKSLFTPKKQIMNFLESNDGTKLLIWDQIYASPDDFEYTLHKLDLKTGESEVITTGDNDGKWTFLHTWRSDNKAVLMEAYGEASKPWIIDFQTGQMNEVPGITEASPSYTVSHQGKYILSGTGNAPNACNEFFGHSNTTYTIYDALTGEKAGLIEASNQEVRILSTSPDESQILYQTKEITADPQKCEQLSTKSFIYDLKTKESQPIQNWEAIINKWHPAQNTIKIEFDGQGAELQHRIIYQGKELYTLPNDITVIGFMVLPQSAK